jgi:hypothetical protein
VCIASGCTTTEDAGTDADDADSVGDTIDALEQ